ncbi:MAG: glycosyltransferase family 2 protein [Candidatus Eisenbacteria bacterium]
MQFTFSVIIPLFNKAESICATIQSVLAQDTRAQEILVVDDGSTDGGGSLVCATFGSAITVVRQPNRGVSAARNRGILQARSEYLAFLDADDLWDQDFLTTVCDLMANYPEARVFGTRYRYETAGGTRIRPMRTVGGYLDYFGTEKVFCASSVVVARECFAQAGMFDETLNRGEDLDMWERLAIRFRIAVTDAVVATYRVSAENRVCTKPPDLNRTYMYRRQTIRTIRDPGRRQYLERLARGRAVDVWRAQGLRGYWAYVTKHFGTRRACLLLLRHAVQGDIRRRALFGWPRRPSSLP